MRRNLMSILISKKEEFVFGVPEQFVTFTHPTREFKIEFSSHIEDTYQLYYSVDDGENWTRVVKETTTPLTSKIDFFGHLPRNTLIFNEQGYVTGSPVFKYFLDKNNEEIKGEISVNGNLRALIINTKYELPKILPKFCFRGLFMNQQALKYADELVLDADSYGIESCWTMFGMCNFLLTTPIISGSKFGVRSFETAFANCLLLVDASSISITSNSFLLDACFRSMFDDCKSLQNVPELSALILSKSCYEYMFYNCTSLKIAPELPATTLTEECYMHMFYNCTSLKIAPELPATVLAYRCYYNMFYNCTSLTEIKLGYTGTDTTYTYDWVYRISTVGTLYKAGTQYSLSGRNTYPSTWTQVPWDPNE